MVRDDWERSYCPIIFGLKLFMLGVVTRIAWPELTDTPAGAGLLILYELGLGDGLNTIFSESSVFGNKSGLPRVCAIFFS
jgi:hypothetical protein